MPGFFTHYIAGQKVYEALPANVKECIDKRKRVFDLGLQGPDFFNYFGAPLKGDPSLHRMAMMLHERSVDEWMSLIYRYIAKQEDADKEIILPYFYGYIIHYAIDCAVNPYILYRSGFVTPNAPLPERFGIYRKRISNAIDQTILKKYMDKTPSEVKVDDMFWVTYDELLEVCRMYPVNIKTVYGKDVSREEVIKAYQDMNAGMKKRIKPGLLKPITSIYEAFSKEFKKGFYTKTVYGPFEADIDFMNENHTEWLAAWDARYSYTESVDDLFQKGIANAIELVKLVFDSYNGGETTSVQAIHAIGGNSFMTGIAWNAPLLLKFYDIIFKKEEEELAPVLEKLASEAE
ncbi:MAG: hypothetical protein IKB86_04365 [Clostridia bacterium]|nr:hypothetical protein [Clostridia bacterium]